MRLLALKDSPAACATLGLNPTLTKLGVFSVSAATAGLGGGVYGARSTRWTLHRRSHRAP